MNEIYTVQITKSELVSITQDAITENIHHRRHRDEVMLEVRSKDLETLLEQIKAFVEQRKPVPIVVQAEDTLEDK